MMSPLRYLLLVCLLASWPVQVVTGSDVIDYDAPYLTVKVRQAPLQEVLKNIAGQVGFELKAADILGDTTVSMRLEKQPVEKILKSLLFGVDYALRYQQQDNPETRQIDKLIIVSLSATHGTGSHVSHSAGDAADNAHQLDRTDGMPEEDASLQRLSEMADHMQAVNQAQPVDQQEKVVDDDDQPEDIQAKQALQQLMQLGR